MQKLLRGGERKERDGETEERSCCSLHRKTQLGQTARSVVVAAWGGVGRNEGKTGREGESTRQGHGKDRPQAYCVFLCLGGGDRHYVSTSAHCCCNRRPSAAASEGETLGSLFNSWGPKAVRHHPFRRLLQCNRL